IIRSAQHGKLLSPGTDSLPDLLKLCDFFSSLINGGACSRRIGSSPSPTDRETGAFCCRRFSLCTNTEIWQVDFCPELEYLCGVEIRMVRMSTGRIDIAALELILSRTVTLVDIVAFG